MKCSTARVLVLSAVLAALVPLSAGNKCRDLQKDLQKCKAVLPVGPTGPAGKNGTNGINGKDGVNGTNGKDGVNGTNGTNGKDGVNGTNGGFVYDNIVTISSTCTYTYFAATTTVPASWIVSLGDPTCNVFPNVAANSWSFQNRVLCPDGSFFVVQLSCRTDYKFPLLISANEDSTGDCWYTSFDNAVPTGLTEDSFTTTTTVRCISKGLGR